MENPLNRELHKILNGMAKRINIDCSIWYNYLLYPEIGGTWECYICNCKFDFNESINKIFIHGYEHLKNNNLLPFI